jgi:DNA-nicking Smr family endonuclease
MIAISKHDKKEWENYVSNFQKFVLIPQRNVLSNPKFKKNKMPISEDKNYLNQSKPFKKKRFKPDSILDLHGYTLYSAKLLLQKFISNCYEKNIRNVLIITGKGQNNKGALKEEVPKWLGDKFFDKYLVNFNLAPRHFGGEGALLVRIKNSFKKI